MTTFYRLLGFLRPYKRGLAASWVLASAAMVMTVAVPWVTGRAVDALAGGPLLPRVRAGVHPAVGPDAGAGGRGDDPAESHPRADRDGARAVRGAHLATLRPARPSGDPGGAAADRRADRERRGEHLRRARREVVRAGATAAAPF